MMRLAELLEGIPDARVLGDRALAVKRVRDDSRRVEPGDLFVAVPGTRDDGARYVAEAVARGAAAVVVHAGAAVSTDAVSWVLVADVRRALGVLAANASRAAQELVITGVTGTSGKTTVSYLMESILVAAERRPGVLGTVSYRHAGRSRPASLTTPGALELHELLVEMRAAGCTDAVLETSSHALDQGRLAGCRFRAAALTNVTQDHLDYHETSERYFAAKAILFRELLDPAGTAVLFADREDGRRMRQQTRGRVLTVSTSEGVPADVTVTARALEAEGLRATLATPLGSIEVSSRLVGEYNLANIALAAGLAVAHGLPVAAIVRGVAALAGVPGRLESVTNSAGVSCLVDYAHKPDALERTLAVLRPLARGRLMVVFGCGGDRDKSKRPIMGEVAARGADVVIVTSDNPRSEEPGAIIETIRPGLRSAGAKELSRDDLLGGSAGFLIEPDRRQAIRTAIRAARPGDTVLIAGKGHEDYQILGARKVHFDDREEAAAAFAEPGEEKAKGLV